MIPDTAPQVADMLTSAVVDAGRTAPGGPPGHAGDADGGQWPSDAGLGRRNQPAGARDRQRSRYVKRKQCKECNNDSQTEVLCHAHFPSPKVKLSGRSLKRSRTSLISTLAALLVFLNVKSAFAASPP